MYTEAWGQSPMYSRIHMAATREHHVDAATASVVRTGAIGIHGMRGWMLLPTGSSYRPEVQGILMTRS